jgi:hypothetical protein
MRRLLVGVLVVVTAVLPSTAQGQVPTQDSVVGYVEFFAGSNEPPGRIGFDVHSGPSGENPVGNVSGQPVGCLAVTGNTAVVGVEVGDQGAFYFSLLDAPIDRWTFSREPGPITPDDCKTRFVVPTGGFPALGANFVITDAVPDSTPPVLTVPSRLTVNARSLGGAGVSYTVTAADDVDASPEVACTPPSGSTFPIGTTRVTCTATDDAGNKTTKSFDVAVRLPSSTVECRQGGWRNFGSLFKNQGDCVSFVATGGKNPPANSA